MRRSLAGRRKYSPSTCIHEFVERSGFVLSRERERENCTIPCWWSLWRKWKAECDHFCQCYRNKDIVILAFQSISLEKKERKLPWKRRESSVCEAIKVKNILCDFIMCEVQRSESKKIANSLIRCARGVPFENLYFSIDNNDLVACSNGHSGTYFVLIFTFRFVPFNFQQRGFAAVCLLYSLYFFFSSLVDFGKELFSFLFSIFVLLFR